MPADNLDQKLAEARRVLTRIPGVFGVGYGYKERGGTTTTELSFRVYVHEKKPLAALPADEVVPAELYGLRTDVLLVLRGDALSCEQIDRKEPLVGGISISNLKLWLAGGPAGGPAAFGTLGFFATRNGSSSRDKYVLLSNQHVLGEAGATSGTTIYQPQLHVQGGQAIITSRDDLHPIGSIDRAGLQDHFPYTYPDGTSDGKYWVDGATAHIDTCYSSWCDTNFRTHLENSILGLEIQKPGEARPSSAIEGIARLRKEDVPEGATYTVFKVGRQTGRTVGKIKGVVEPVTDNTTGIKQENCIVIENVGPNCEGGTIFADRGDSGAVIVNEQRQIIGLLFGGDLPFGIGQACHIHPVLAALDITMISPANRIRGSSGTLLDVPVRVDGDGGRGARAEALRHEILDSERGRAYRALVERHREEVAYLVNHVRPVTVAWHRARAPDFLAHYAHASRHPGHRVPRELHGIAREDALERVEEALGRHGSAALRADVDRYADEVRALVADVDDVEALAERLRTAERAEPLAVWR